MDEKIEGNKFVEVLDSLFEKMLNGIPVVSPSIEEFAEDYLKQNPNPRKAAISMQNYQIAKCAAGGVLAGFGGAIALPVALPAEVTSVLYVQMRMIACTAYMAGYDVKSDQVQTMIYACLAGVSINAVIKAAGIKVAEKAAMAAIKKIPGKVLININKKIGFRLFTKFGEKGVINFGKLVPGVGAFVGGGADFIETKAIADRAYKMFMLNDVNVHDNRKPKKKAKYIDIADTSKEKTIKENAVSDKKQP